MRRRRDRTEANRSSVGVGGLLGIGKVALNDLAGRGVVTRGSKKGTYALLLAFITRVQVHSDRIDVTLDQMGLARCLGAEPDKRQPAYPASDREQHLMILTVHARLKRTGIEMRMVVDDGSAPATVDCTLVRLLVRAHAIRARLLQDPSLTLREIAAEEGVVSSYVSRLIRLSFLAPDIVTAIFNGRHPAQLTANRLMEDTRLPLEWKAQRELLCLL